jgi:hypothetical protein
MGDQEPDARFRHLPNPLRLDFAPPWVGSVAGERESRADLHSGVQANENQPSAGLVYELIGTRQQHRVAG